ncbi:ABC-three component system protein [Chryseobacterium sp. Mn2064]|uniref:ABC-three component system protein n=1 Tax=Chryseobacterium sp. Mn2064 TaxID=3395263 RepID=UPI003BBC0732
MNDNNNEVKVEDSSIGGDLVGRDSYKTYNYNYSNSSSTYIQDLYQRYEKEKKENPGFKDFCDELDYYNSVIDEQVIGLEEKLRQGGRERILFYALTVKDAFHRKLLQNSQLSVIAQEINIYLLAKVRRGFMMEIYGLICDGAPEEKINQLITERIIKPVQDDLGINLFRYTEDDIMGMIFFLTGNCHIKWN